MKKSLLFIGLFIVYGLISQAQTTLVTNASPITVFGVTFTLSGNATASEARSAYQFSTSTVGSATISISRPITLQSLHFAWGTNVQGARVEIYSGASKVMEFNWPTLSIGASTTVTVNKTEVTRIVFIEDGTSRSGLGELGRIVFTAPPVATTAAASNITSSSAVLGGQVTTDGGATVTDRGVLYSFTDTNPTIGDANVIQAANGSGTGTFSATISSIRYASTYYARAYATNAVGTSYGAAVSFNTPAPTLSPSSNSPVCTSNTINLSALTVTGATYSWTGPNGFSSSLQNPSISDATAAKAGTYRVTVTVDGFTSPAATTTVVVNNTPATPMALSNSPLCSGTDMNLSTATVTGATYSWTGPDGFVSSDQNPTRTGATTAMAGTYTVTVITNGCASAVGTVNVVVNSTVATPTASSNGPVCSGNAINLSTPTVAGATYSWTGPGLFTSNLQNPSRANATTAMQGIYRVTITVNGCTSAAGEVTVAVYNTLAAPLAFNSGPVCIGGTVTLSTPTGSGVNYSWTGPNGFTSTDQNPSISNVTAEMAGIYRIYRINNGCPSAAGTTTVIVKTPPATPTASSNGTVCSGNAINLSTPTVTGAGYSWTGPNGFTSSAQNPTITNATTAMDGTYSVKITVDGCTSAAATTTVVVKSTPATPRLTSNSPVCIGSTIYMSTAYVVGASYSWTGPNGFTSTDQDPSIPESTLVMAGTYSLTVTVNGCTSAAGTTIIRVGSNLSTPTASNNGPICTGSTINLSTPTVTDAFYSWSGPDGFSSTAQNPSIANAIVAKAGIYRVTITKDGCTSEVGSTTVVVGSPPATPTASSNGTVTVGNDIVLSTPEVPGATYIWTGPGFISTERNPTIHNAFTALSGTYRVTVTVNGCVSTAGTTSVTVQNRTPTPVIVTPANGTTIITAKPSYSGTAAVNSTITVYVDGQNIGTSNSDGAGSFTFSQPTNLSEGSHTVYATAQATSNAVSNPSGTNTFTVNVSPTISYTGTPIARSTTYGSASTSTQITVSGTSITGGILVTAPTGFEVSTNNTAFANAVTLGTSGSISATVYIRLAATTGYGSYNGDIVLSSASATSVNVAMARSSVVGRALIITPTAGQAKTYGNADPLLTYTIDGPGLLNGDTFSGRLGRADGDDVGTYAITLGTLTAGNNYDVTLTAGATFEVTQRAITITPDAGQAKTYGNPDPAFSYTVGGSGLANGESLTGSLTRAVGENVGSYALTIGSLSASTNYIVSFTSGKTFAINPRPITVTANSGQSKIYGNPDPTTLTYSISSGSLAFTDTFSGSLSRATGNNVGSYAINKATLALSSNYDITFSPGITFAIQKRPITVTPDANLKKFYRQQDPYLSFTVGGLGLLDHSDLSGSLSPIGDQNAGTYVLTQGTLVATSNYELTFVTGVTFTIVPMPAHFDIRGINKVYDGSTAASVNLIFYPLEGDTFNYTYTASFATAAAGTYKVIYVSDISLTGGAAANYSVAATTAMIGADITARPIVVTADAKNKIYGDNDPPLTYTYIGNLVGADEFSGSLTRSAGNNSGVYAINQGTLDLGSNYNITYSSANLTIGKKSVAITAAAKSKIYDDADPEFTYSVLPALVNGDTFTGSLTRAAGEGIGAYTINQGTLALSNNYALTYAGADLTIGKKQVTVTAAATSKIYGDADPALTYSVSPALANGDTFSGSLTRVVGDNIGTYAINQGTLALSNNYALTYASADLTIGKKLITVTAGAKSKIYGDADPALTYTVLPALVNGDAFSGSLTRVVGDNIGTYAIKLGTLALSNNYALTYTSADLTIGKKSVTVMAAAKSKIYGEADPAFTYTVLPALVNGDIFSGSLTRIAGENIGTYAINEGTLALSNNYTLTYASSDLTINKKAVIITAAAKNKIYGDADPAFTYTVLPALVNGDTFSGNLIRVAGENIGTYAINQGTLALNDNYALTYVGSELAVGKKSITVTASAKTKTYGDADPALTYILVPALVNGDVVTGSLTRAIGENIGTYPINQGTLALNSNYSLNYVGSDLSIGKRTITVTAMAKTKAYGDADPAFTYSVLPVLVNGDTFSGSLTRAGGENTGTYTINQGTLALNANYILAYVGANLTIGKKIVTVTATAKNKIYGETDPSLTYTFAPALITGDSFSGALARVAGENAGNYAINVGSLALNNNYTLNYTAGNLTINKATLTVTANNTVMCQGNNLPAFGVVYSGLKFTDNENSLTTQPTVSTIANSNSVAGTYALLPGAGVSNNYSFNYVNGQLLINALPVASISSDIGVSISKGLTAQLTATGGVAYVWANAAGIISGQNTALLLVRPSVNTTYTVTVTNANGCSTTSAIDLTVMEDFVTLKGTTILTPNGDGKNDFLIIRNIDLYPNNEIKLFDLAGRVVYSMKGYNNTWDGTLNGSPLAKGTYYYIINYGDGRARMRGFVSIVRD